MDRRQTDSHTMSTMTYRLNCTACSFEAVLDIDVDDVFDVIEDHQEEYEADRSEHFVDFERVSQAADD